MDSELCSLSQSGERDDRISCLCNYNCHANFVNFNFNLLFNTFFIQFVSLFFLQLNLNLIIELNSVEFKFHSIYLFNSKCIQCHSIFLFQMKLNFHKINSSIVNFNVQQCQSQSNLPIQFQFNCVT
jgi:hypothetical protein